MLRWAGERGIKKVFSATHQRGAYSFYRQDPDTNWWELEIWEDAISPVVRPSAIPSSRPQHASQSGQILCATVAVRQVTASTPAPATVSDA